MCMRTQEQTMRINEGSGLSYYLQIKEFIKEEIVQEKILEGKRVPAMRELAERFGVGLVTIHKAISQLKEEGVLYSRPKKGIFLTENGKNIIAARKTAITIGL